MHPKTVQILNLIFYDWTWKIVAGFICVLLCIIQLATIQSMDMAKARATAPLKPPVETISYDRSICEIGKNKIVCEVQK